MQFFHFKEIPPASFPTMNPTLLLCPRANNNPTLALPSLYQTQLLPSACGSLSTGLDLEAASSGNSEVLWQVLPHLSLTDSGVEP